jgi:hypothetical protein
VVAIANLPSQTTLQNYGPEERDGIVSHQHPDHDWRRKRRLILLCRKTRRSNQRHARV